MAETSAEKVTRIRAELAAKRAGVAVPAAPAPAAPAPSAPTTPPVAAAPAAPAPSAYAHIPGMTAAVWDVLSPDTKAAVLAQNPAPVTAPAPAAPVPCVPQVTLYEQQTAPINPPDCLQGTEPPVVTAAPAAPPVAEAPKKTRGKAAVIVAEPPAYPLDGTSERIATALETIAALLEVLATK